MTVEQILMLADRGFTAQQITAFAQMQQAATPAPAVPTAPAVPSVPTAPAAPAVPAAPVAPADPAAPAAPVDPLAAMQQQMQQLTQTILNNSVANSQQPPMQTADDVLYAVLIDPDNTK